MDKNARKIRDAVVRRGITSLFHFSPFQNAASILTDGLRTRKDLLGSEVDFCGTDRMRLDGDGICLTIQQAQKVMLASKMREAPHVSWIIYDIDPVVLWTHTCDFCWTNASSREIMHHKTYRSGPWGFERMFEDSPISSTDPRMMRETFGRDDNMPTRHDAEVKVMETIAPSFIRHLFVARPAEKEILDEGMRDYHTQWPVFVLPEMLELAQGSG